MVDMGVYYYLWIIMYRQTVSTSVGLFFKYWFLFIFFLV